MSDLMPVGRTRPRIKREQSLAIRDIAFVLSRRRWLVLGTALPIFIVASLGLFRKTGGVVASAKVLLELRGPTAPQWNTSTASVDYDRALSTYQHLAMSVPVATRAAEALQDSIGVITASDPTLRHLSNKTALTEYLAQNLNVVLIGESNILDMRFTAANSVVALMADRALRDAFLDYSISALRNSHAISYYREQIAQVGAEMDSLLALRGQISRDHGYSSFQDDLRFGSGQVANLEDQYNEAGANLRQVESKVAYFRKAWAENPDFVPLGDPGILSTPLIDAKVRVDEYQDKLNQMLSLYTPDSPEVARQRELLAGARRLLDSARDVYLMSYEAEVQSVRDRESTLRQQIEKLRGTLQAAPEVYRLISMIDSDIESRRQVLKDLQSKLGEVRISQMADERVSRMIKLTEPEIEIVVSESRKFVYAFLISFFGLAFSLLVAFVVNQQDHRLYTRQHVEEYLDIPVLTAVSDAQSRSGAK